LGFEYGLYCEDDWVNSLNEMLSNSVINICTKNGQTNDKIAQVLAQVAWETGYFSNVY